MGLHTVSAWAKHAALALVVAFLASPALAANDPVAGNTQYHSVCTACHNTDPHLDSPGAGTYPAPYPYGANATDLQDLIDGGMGSPNTNSLKTADSSINDTVSNIAAYLAHLNDPTATITSTGHDFGSILTTATATYSFSVANNGVNALHVSSVTINDTVNFGVSSTCGTVTSGNSCTVTVTFKPQSGGSFTGRSVTINHDAAGGSSVVNNFQGVGVVPAPVFSVSPTTLNFTAKLGASASSSVTIGNPGGTANLVVQAPVYSSPRYVRAASSTCNAGTTTLIPNASCVLTTTFTPIAAGAANGTLTLSHNAVGSPGVVTLVGTGTQALINPTAATLAFDNVQLGVPKTLNLNVTNTGTANLVFSVEPSDPSARSGSGAADYSVAGTCHVASPLTPASGCTLAVTFTPSTLAARPATLTVSSDATNGPLVVALSGAGVALPEPAVTFPGSDFPDTVIGETSAATRTITIHNDRTRDVVYTMAAITDFTISAESCPTHVVPGGGGNCTATIRFAPTLGAGEGRRQGTYTVSFTGTSGDDDPSTVTGVVAGVALLPLNLSATTLDAAAVVGSPSTVSLLLTNRSAASLTPTAFTFGGATPADYTRDPSSTCSAGTAIAASASCTFVIRFAPTVAGTRNATLTITHTALGSPQVVQLHGTATPAPQGKIELSAAALSFADTQLASTSTQSVTIANTGNLALTFSSFTIGGPAAAEFVRGGDCAVASPLPIGGSCTMTVAFSPATLGLRTATLTIASNASNGTAVLALSGTGVPIPAPQVTLAPTTLDFGNQTIGGLYPTRTVRLTNSGTADLAIASIAVAGTGFTAAGGNCPAVLAASAGCDIGVAFVATAATAYSGTVTVTDNAAGSPHVAALKGNGVANALPVLVWSPAVSTLDFGNVSAGSLSPVQTVTLRNAGPGGVTLTVLNAIGTGASSFSVVGGSCALGTPVFEGDTCTVDIRFAPGSAGLKTAAVQIASTGSFPPVLTLTGTGLSGPNPSLALSAESLAFTTTMVGARSLPATVRLTSSGSGVVTVSAMEASGAYTIDSTTCPAMPFTLPAGSDCTVSVAFAPTTAGASAGMLKVTSDAAPALREVALSGQGEKPAEVSGGGCTIGGAPNLHDPTLWLLALLAAAVLGRRALRRRGDRR